jgi:hypothetical protein
MSKKMFSCRAGDVFLMQIAELPKSNMKAIEKDPDGSTVLARGEHRGARHRIDDGNNVALLEAENGERFLQVNEEEVDLLHDGYAPGMGAGHATIPVPNGVYRVIIQREYTPEAIRQVLD